MLVCVYNNHIYEWVLRLVISQSKHDSIVWITIMDIIDILKSSIRALLLTTQ